MGLRPTYWDESALLSFIDSKQIDKQDLQKFDTDLMEKGNEDRTRHNRVQHVVTFLKNKEGRRIGPAIPDVSITVKYVEEPPLPYTKLDNTTVAFPFRPPT